MESGKKGKLVLGFTGNWMELRVDRTGEAVVMAVGKFVVDEDGVRAVLVLEALLHVLYLVLWHLEARPAVPLEACRLAEAAETGDETARGHGKGVATIVGALDGDGQSVGEQQQAARRRLGLLVGRGG